jgi:hypothetical protein
MRTLLLRAALVLTLNLLLAWGGGWAALRNGPHFEIALDTLSGGGGASSSASYREPDSSVGQEAVSGPSGGLTVLDYAGIVQFWSLNQNASTFWAAYE